MVGAKEDGIGCGSEGGPGWRRAKHFGVCVMQVGAGLGQILRCGSGWLVGVKLRSVGRGRSRARGRAEAALGRAGAGRGAARGRVGGLKQHESGLGRG